MRAVRNLLRSAFIATALASFFPTCSTQAEPIPGLGDIPAGYYFTTDMAPVEVLLRAGYAPQPDKEPILRLSIPRAYIYFAAEYRQRDFGTLPPQIDTTQLHILLTYPDGLPYSVAVEKHQREMGVSSSQAADDLRGVRLVGEINPTTPDAYTLSYLSPHPDGWDGAPAGEYEGMRFYQLKSGRSTYFGEPDDMLRKVQCWEPPDKLKPRKFCTYFTVLRKNAIAQIQFVDFRAHGGVAFARERIALFRKTICQYLACDEIR